MKAPEKETSYQFFGSRFSEGKFYFNPDTT